MSTKNMTDAEFDAYMEEKEYDRLYDPDEVDSDYRQDMLDMMADDFQEWVELMERSFE
jgi:hypothetical protein